MLAAEWADGIMSLINDYMRQAAVSEAQANMDYLNERAQKTNILEMRQTTYVIMQDELKNAMPAQGSPLISCLFLIAREGWAKSS